MSAAPFLVPRPHFAFDRFHHARVEYIATYRGCDLVWFGDEPVNLKHYYGLAARDERGQCQVLDVSRYTFTPTNRRFRWLIDNGLPDRRHFGTIYPVNNRLIDEALAGKLAA